MLEDLSLGQSLGEEVRGVQDSPHLIELDSATPGALLDPQLLDLLQQDPLQLDLLQLDLLQLDLQQLDLLLLSPQHLNLHSSLNIFNSPKWIIFVCVVHIVVLQYQNIRKISAVFFVQLLP